MSEDIAWAVELARLRYRWQGSEQMTLDIPEVKIALGEKVFLRGPSGSGKSTLLGLIGGVLSKQEGEMKVLGQSYSGLSAARLDRFRSDHIGFVFQSFNLLPYLSIRENIETPLLFSGLRKQKVLSSRSIEDEVSHLCESLNLPLKLLNQEVSRLSVGQQQRVAVARALLGSPEILIADEPTSALDAGSRDRFIELLLEESSKRQMTVLFVSHDASLASHFDRDLRILEINKVQASQIDQSKPEQKL